MLEPDDEDLDFLAHQFEWTRIRQNLSVRDVVDEAGFDDVDKATRMLCDIEDGKRPADLAVYEKLAEALFLDVRELSDRLEERRNRRRRNKRQQLPPPVLGELLRSARKRLGLAFDEFVDRVDGAIDEERLERLEVGRARFPTDAELEVLAESLEISEEAIENACARERRIYDRLDEAPTLVLRAMPAVYQKQDHLPAPASTARQLTYATRYAREMDKKVCLVFPDDRSIYIEPDGSRRESYRPPSGDLPGVED